MVLSTRVEMLLLAGIIADAVVVVEVIMVAVQVPLLNMALVTEQVVEAALHI